MEEKEAIGGATMSLKNQAKETETLETARQTLPDEEHEGLTIGETCRFICFSTILVIILLSQLNTEDAYQIAATTSSILETEDFEEIISHEDAINWITEDFLRSIARPFAYYNLSNREGGDYMRFAWFNRVITPIRMVQRRIKLIDNEVDRTNTLYPYKWAVNTIDPYEQDVDGESKESFGNESDIQSVMTECGYTENMFEYQSSIGIMDSGGFQFLADSIATTGEEAEAMTTCMRKVMIEQGWLDNQTATLCIDYGTYNAHASMLTYVLVEFIFYNSGMIANDIVIRSIPSEHYSGTQDILRAVLEVIYVCLVLYYALIEIMEIKTEYEKQVGNQKERLRHLIEDEDSDEEEEQRNAPRKKEIFLKPLYRALLAHISNFWNILDITSLVLSFIAISLWIVIIVKKPRGEIESNTETTNELLITIDYLKSYTRVNSINLCIIFFRMIKYLGRFERIRLVHSTFRRAGGEIFYFFVLLTSIFFSFVVFGHLGFGQTTAEYQSIWESIISCLILLLNDMENVLILLDKNLLVASIYIIMFTLMINFILTNMFIAIVSTAYGEKLKELNRKNKAKRNDIDYQKHIYNVVKEKIKYWCFEIAERCCKHRDIESKIEMREFKFKEQNDIKNIRVKNPNLDFLDVKAWNTEVNVETLNDKEKIQRMTEKSKVFSKKVKSAIIFISFAIIYTTVLVYQQHIDTKYQLRLGVKSTYEETVFSGEKNIEDVNDFNTTVEWVSSAFNDNVNIPPSIFIVTDNYEVGAHLSTGEICDNTDGSLRLTFRKVRLEDNGDTSLDQFESKSRLETFDAGDSSGNEFTKDLSLTKCTWVHSKDSGFNDAGGYIFYTSTLDFAREINQLAQSDYFLDDYINTLTIDQVFYNADHQYFIYSAMNFIFESSGMISYEYYIWPMNFKIYDLEVGNIFRSIFEFVFVILLVYHIVITVLTIRKDYKNYESWKTRFYAILTNDQIRIRNEIKPEWLRRITNILTPYVLIDLLSYTCSITAIIYWILFLNSRAQEIELPVEDGEFHDEMGEASVYLERYLTWSSFNLLFIYIRILNYLTIKRSLRFLQDTLGKAMKDILYFLIMLMAILMGYVFMSYLSFGHSLENYSTVFNSLMTCFSIIIGEFEYAELKSTDLLMSILFFFTLAIFATYILLNIFIAILERAFEHVKQQIDKSEDTNFVEFIILIFVKVLKNLINRPHKDSKGKIEARLAPIVFDDISTGTEPMNNPYEWGIKMVDEILIERGKRGEVFQQLDDIFRVRKEKEIERMETIFKDKTGLNEEFSARKDYWNYLRIGYLNFHKHQTKVKDATDELLEVFDKFAPKYEYLKERIEDYNNRCQIEMTKKDEYKVILKKFSKNQHKHNFD